MTKHNPPPIFHIVSFHIYHALFAVVGGVMVGGSIAASNGVSHVTEACGRGIVGCGASQHWAIWSAAIAVIFYALIINSQILYLLSSKVALKQEPTNVSLLSDEVDEVVRWIISILTTPKELRRFKQWLISNLLLGLLGVIAGAMSAGAAGGFLYGNFITGMGAANGVPLIGWLFGILIGMVFAGISALLFGLLSGVTSALMLPRQL